ncbi:hypothetical protein TIFTF001_054450 [Ficus carica]|uniref:Uncharacterized protein n=1 Tax=Ficus carica TaxID=3494 RepID=A0AA88EHM4_FICCA|nr:hypothetical protein TIFTF001_054450 [Ficus carica]
MARLSNTPNVAFAYQIQHVVDHLESRGVRALPRRRYGVEELRGQNWIIRQPHVSVPMRPTEVETRNLYDGSVSIRFRDYTPQEEQPPPKYNNLDEEIASEEEELIQEDHIVVVLVQQDPESEERWDTLGQTSGKYDFLVRYSAPAHFGQSIEEIIPTGWDEDEEDDPDERMEQLNFMGRSVFKTDDPIFDESEEEKDFTNPFAEDGGEKGETIFALQQEEEYEMEYPKLRTLEKVYYTSEVTSRYSPPVDSVMGPPNYPPARNFDGAGTSNAAPPPNFDRRNVKFRAGYNDELWSLPPAQQKGGAMLVIPEQIRMFHDVFSRWESITKNHVSSQGFTDTRDKIEYMENLLGEVEKLIWIQW